MTRISFVASLAILATATLAIPTQPVAPRQNAACAIIKDQPGSENVGKAANSQFITGQCFADDDCASQCCSGTADGTATCRAKGALSASESCGFKCTAANQVIPIDDNGNAATDAANGGNSCATVDQSVAGSQNVGVAGAQFVTGPCVNDGNCASGCCVLAPGAAVATCRNEPALSGGLACGFSCNAGNAATVSNAAVSSNPGTKANNNAAVTGGTCAAVDSSVAGSQNVGVAGAQFVTGPCVNDGNCASGCCVLAPGADVATCRNEPALSGGLVCGFSCTGASGASKNEQSSNNNGGNAAAGPSGSCAGVDSAAPGAQNVGTGARNQFITGQCTSDADCTTGCCVGTAGAPGKCRAPLSLSGSEACGFTC